MRNDWNSFVQALREAPKKAGDWVNDLRSIPDRADGIAEGVYGSSSARDASAKNAFRHALGTGMLTQKLGGGLVGGTAAKMAGYAWELPTLMSYGSTKEQQADSRHDLNANALGAYLATKTGSQEELVKALRGYAARSVVQDAPPVLSRPVGYLTRSVR